jgi:peptide/nickel transport system ATP-binding protein
VLDLIAEPLDIHRLCKGNRRRERVLELMEQVGLNRRLLTRFPHEFSGGQRQRIGIARALATNPEFIVCDEPVSALDVSIQAQILNLLQDLQVSRGLTYMFITHDMSVVKHISDEICVMYCGRVVEKCKTKELFRNPSHPYTVALLSAIPVPNIHKKKEPIIIKGEVTSPINPKPCCRFAGRCEHARPECFTSEPALTDLGGGHLCACFAAAEAAGVQAPVIVSETP